MIAIKLNERKNSIIVNEIKSIYGKTNLKEYLSKHIDLKQLNVIDNKKAEILSRVIGFQLPKALIKSSYNTKLPLNEQSVNTKISIHDKLEQFQKEIHGKDSVEIQKQKEHQHER